MPLQDVEATLKWMEGHGAEALAAATRLREAMAAGKLLAIDHPFYTSPLALWDLPRELRQRFQRCDITLFKGDGAIHNRGASVWLSVGASLCVRVCGGAANYRRILGDRHFAFDTPFAEVAGYAALRSVAPGRGCCSMVWYSCMVWYSRHFPCPIATLRTCKAEVIVGVPPEVVAPVAAVDEDWLVTGKYGLIQFHQRKQHA